ncbi:unnamed protein product [Rotaria sp. Silwood2]|nr:unnamed protein product [Rotaria sp. Silwood2]
MGSRSNYRAGKIPISLIRGYTLGHFQLQKYQDVKALIRSMSLSIPHLQNKLFTCELCKIFLRRNALKPMEKFCCRNNDSCVVTSTIRQCCKKCRLNKCFKVGWSRSPFIDIL